MVQLHPEPHSQKFGRASKAFVAGLPVRSFSEGGFDCLPQAQKIKAPFFMVLIFYYNGGEFDKKNLFSYAIYSFLHSLFQNRRW
ncbi:MAG: hypothetical protein Q7S28_01915 [bacterium]|nr:hypothetical protein [bacterium]